MSHFLVNEEDDDDFDDKQEGQTTSSKYMQQLIFILTPQTQLFHEVLVFQCNSAL